MCPPKPLRMEGGGVLIPVSGSLIEWTCSVGLVCRVSVSNLRRACAELKSHRLLAALCRICGFAALRARAARSDRQLRAAHAVENQKPAANTASKALSYKPLRGFGVPCSPRQPADQRGLHRHRRISFHPSYPRSASAAVRRRERGDGARVALIEEGWWTNGRAQQSGRVRCAH